MHIGQFVPVTSEQWRNVLDAGHYFAVPLVLWACRQALKKLDDRINATVVLRVTESRSLLIQHIDKRFAEHEKCDDRIVHRLTNIEKGMEKQRRGI